MSGYAASDSATTQSLGDAISAEDIRNSGITAAEDVAQYAAMLGDDALILAQRLGWWISRAPEMEEDIALGNIALDLIGHTRFLYTYAGTAWDKTEDDLAYFRTEEEFRSARLVEQENGDFGQTIARQLCSRTTSTRCTPSCRTLPMKPWRQSLRRPSRKWNTTLTTPTSGCCVSAWALESPTVVLLKASSTCGLTSTNSSRI